VSKTGGSIPLGVEFRAEARGGVSSYSYEWHFGDGTTSTDSQNPGGSSVTKYYSAIGTYAPWVRVRDFLGTQQLAAVPTIEAYLPLSLLCVASPTSGPAPLEVTIEARLSGGVPPYHFIYVFNAASPDGGLLTTSTRVRTVYTLPGLYEAFVTAFDSKGQRVRAECGDSNGFITVTP
jgi:PKD repeat protein